MAILYKPFQSVLKTKDDKQLFYPRVVLKGNVSTDRLAQEIADYSSLTKGDTKNALDNLITVMTLHLQASESVTIDGLGTFRPVMKAKKGVESAELVSPAQSTLTVRFTPGTTRNPDRTVATRSLSSGARFVSYGTSDAASGSGDNGGSGTPGGEEPENPLG